AKRALLLVRSGVMGGTAVDHADLLRIRPQPGIVFVLDADPAAHPAGVADAHRQSCLLRRGDVRTLPVFPVRCATVFFPDFRRNMDIPLVSPAKRGLFPDPPDQSPHLPGPELNLYGKEGTAIVRLGMGDNSQEGM